MTKFFYAIQLIVLFLTLKAGAQPSAFKIADSLYNTGSYTAAINEYAKINNTSANLQIAKAYNAIGNYDKAIAQYTSVVTKDTSLLVARFNLGKLYLKTNKYKQATILFGKLVQISKANPEFSYNLARAYSGIKQDTTSVLWYKKALEVDSTHLRALQRLSVYYVAEHENDSVVKYADKGLRIFENDPVLINVKALALFNKDNFKESALWYEKLLSLGKIEKQIYNRLGYAYNKLEKYKKSVENYKFLLSYDDEDVKTLRTISEVYRKDKELDSATVYIHKAIAAHSYSLDEEYQVAARIAVDKKDYKTAIKYYNMAFDEDPTNPSYLYQASIYADKFYKDPKVKLNYYTQLKEKTASKGVKNQYFVKFAEKRISELKSEIFANGR
ncbi:tetratricopeptide repeat protein [Cellulophaga fucicola]|uniref:Tetratricopeptide repeat-containing protein n=1 Tax=Cellulophaga fucicola TaxID=76595 RepID=A0A1K1QTL2_9FLAO|nr:tetratricopeptide repeat protein [Cellulophaga fucicola]SFW63017.1 Tetratricopeptide repeat-containing protein [Cellulophaga fucicola]